MRGQYLRRPTHGYEDAPSTGMPIPGAVRPAERRSPASAWVDTAP
ncbi:hypothetical protein VIOLET_79 [Mycobacterium phage Violet]|uniref:Uncharacterized protein n=1 Tax=Mycobacterium phage Violet TaxID=1086800 RepID=G3MER4_9CAUD|nr:hypothetical protein VIOLET_79 [Mycobacterium phage Violet]AEO94532.1 hypothetical protein VIOLET_79 [Mycobacterium phage Violet]